MNVDVFNGDADGLCALHQYRLANPGSATLITGVKRDVELVSRVDATAGDEVAVFDISLRSNRAHVARLLDQGAFVRYFDHHEAGDLPQTERFEGHIDTAPTVCTSILVDHWLGGRFRPWAVAAAYGDNLQVSAETLADHAGFDREQRSRLRALGECLNYNGYGDTLEDLYFDPVRLYAAMSAFECPFEFAERAPEMHVLRDGLAQDLAWMSSVEPATVSPNWRMYLLPDMARARRSTGMLANRVAVEQPALAHAVLTPNTRGTWTVSVRAPVANPNRALDVCKPFGGGGRHAAAGINDLQDQDIGRFVQQLQLVFGCASSVQLSPHA
jgi:hypothetical protein